MINAALVQGDVILTAPRTGLGTDYFRIDGTVVVPSSRTMTLENAELRLSAGAARNVSRNARQNAAGDSGITLIGRGRANIDGQAALQTSTSAINSIGVSWVNVTNLVVQDVTIGPCMV
ncbi:hypothetical protein [Microbacterium sp. cx-59]|uniref:hypothetical protein n=1 Tax=Microbacterium sp. cx-59 TaxID=2891207 RepID=UPI001E510567|nr:hypothetical protein [Microbacterium sp. cx-59]MCC4908104.1 hypothetical protein [Microbacterium sp. cx-59]